MTNYDLRWQQRFKNFSRAFKLFESAVLNPVSSKLEKEGVIQRFEYTFELGWKTLRDYMRFAGAEVDLPRDVIKQAFAMGLIHDGKKWIEMLESRNVMAHTYDEAAFELVYHKITKEFYEALKKVFETLATKVDG